ncbi:unnamed protein product [Bursaphelenchus xylophilus]|uniref:(pine wood nematode) hypothetical protein n=1 Tax=Bursaphelenchus xylophilus TaxID=6326 RepID=A0A1I7RKT5_BURXY|nr:unnamed protein product [Bursaphelenchus xylophilus]CAG9131108.1 unnamed protein product [Bursaphelenchus xylophilus]
MSNQGYSRLVNDPSASDTFVADSFQQQQRIVNEQDEDLEKVAGSISTLKHMSSRIGEELEEQSDLLDDLSNTMHRTQAQMDTVMRKLAKVTGMDDDSKQWTAIFVLIGLFFFLLMVLVAF